MQVISKACHSEKLTKDCIGDSNQIHLAALVLDVSLRKDRGVNASKAERCDYSRKNHDDGVILCQRNHAGEPKGKD
jgi:hypothetical protein